jgi:hypothetical protein
MHFHTPEFVDPDATKEGNEKPVSHSVILFLHRLDKELESVYTCPILLSNRTNDSVHDLYTKGLGL